MALYDDESLIVVPGSHKRPRTAEERNCGPYGEVKDQMKVKLKSGDILFYM